MKKKFALAFAILTASVSLVACSKKKVGSNDNNSNNVTDNGNNDSGNTSGGNTSGGNTTGGNNDSGNTSGGNTTGGNNDSGNTSGGSTTGGNNNSGSNTNPIDKNEPTVDQGTSSLEIIKTSSGFETAYAEFKPVTGATSYNVYMKKSGDSNYKAVDSELLRKYKDYYRVDAVGLSAGTYTMKICPVIGGVESQSLEIKDISVIAHDRSGFGFVGGTSSGAYNEDGTLKSNANLIYVSNENKNSVSLSVTGAETDPCVGLQKILNGYAKGKEKKPLCVRLIGNITDFSIMEDGDILVANKLGDSGAITIEGIGNDTVANGWGIRIKDASNIEVRNIAFMNCDSKEGDSVSIQQNANHLWIHNNDFFYGGPGGDSDQAKGDGALDTKKSTYITHSYNHFWDTGKTHLNGNKDTIVNYITYHHNWYDHSDSRHPLVRVSNAVHCYNNFYDGIAKYGMIARMGACIFSESNYFLNAAKPQLIGQQGSDILNGSPVSDDEDGGMIKSYGDVYAGTTVKAITQNDNATSFDVYLVANKADTVPSTFKSLVGGKTYSNFDTASTMYSYTPDTAEVAKENVKRYAGRIDGGDIKYSFEGKTFQQKDGAGVMQTVDSTRYYGVDAELKSLLVGYKTSIVATYVGGYTETENNSSTGGSSTGGNSEGGSSTGGNSPTETVSGAVLHFNGGSKNDSANMFTTTGDYKKASDISGKPSYTLNDTALTHTLKFDSKGSISFTLTKECTIKIVACTKTAGQKIQIVQGETSKPISLTTSAAEYTETLGAGSYVIKQVSGESYIFAVIVE